MQCSGCSLLLEIFQKDHSHKTRRGLEEEPFPPALLLVPPPSVLLWAFAAGLGTISVIQSGTSQALHLPATEAHVYLFGGSCSLDKNTNHLCGARRCVCKVNQCAGAKKKKSKMCCWLTMACPEIKSRSVCGHKEQPDCLPSILLSFVGERVLVSLRQFA